MKNLLFIISFLLFSCIIYAQNKISFDEINETGVNLYGRYKSYKILKITENIHSVGDGERIILSYRDDYSFVLQENRLFADDYIAIIKKENTIEYKKLDELGFDGKYFRNANATSNYQMTMSSFENQYTFYVKSAGKTFYIEPLRKFYLSASADQYVYYEVKDIINNVALGCGVKDENSDGFQTNRALQPNVGCKTVELNMCIDYSMYAAYNSINASINRTFEILNLTQLDYTIANGLNFDVNYIVKRQFILTCHNCNYWPSSNDISTNSQNFHDYFLYSPMFDAKSDIRVFWQHWIPDPEIPTNNVALASTNSLQQCPPEHILTTVSQVVLRNFPEATDSMRKTLSHEFGHNFGCGHINDGSNIMHGSTSYLGHFWNPISVGIINNTLTSSNCFTDCQTELCYNESVEDITLTVDSDTKVINLGWLSETGMEYKLRLYNYTSNTWTPFTTVSYPVDSFVFPYNNNAASCSKKYKIEIVPVCSGISGFQHILVLNVPDIANPSLWFQSMTQNQTLCSGETYTFSVVALYPGTNPTYQWKIDNVPAGTNSATFTTAALQNNNFLSCQITSDEPCLLSQTATVSQTVTVMPQPCSLSNVDFETPMVAYYPNPVKNLFTVKSVTEIKSISIYNMLGQKLLDNTIHRLETILDLSFLPHSTYLVKIEFENHSQIINVIKVE